LCILTVPVQGRAGGEPSPRPWPPSGGFLHFDDVTVDRNSPAARVRSGSIAALASAGESEAEQHISHAGGRCGGGVDTASGARRVDSRSARGRRNRKRIGREAGGRDVIDRAGSQPSGKGSGG